MRAGRRASGGVGQLFDRADLVEEQDRARLAHLAAPFERPGGAELVASDRAREHDRSDVTAVEARQLRNAGKKYAVAASGLESHGVVSLFDVTSRYSV